MASSMAAGHPQVTFKLPLVALRTSHAEGPSHPFRLSSFLPTSYPKLGFIATTEALNVCTGTSGRPLSLWHGASPDGALSAAFLLSMIGILCRRKNSTEVTCPPSLGQGSVTRLQFVRVCTLFFGRKSLRAATLKGRDVKRHLPEWGVVTRITYWEVRCQEGSKWHVCSSRARNFQNGDTG